MKGQVALVLVVALLFVSACGTSDTEVPPSTVSPVETPGAGTQLSPLTPPTAMPPPTPSSSEAGTVVGFLLEGGDPPQPVGQVILYLGEIVRLADGSPGMAKLNRQTAPSTQTDAYGRFVFTEVPVGQRSLFLDLVTNAVVLNHPSSGGDLLIEVGGGTITDLGELVYSDLPLTP